MCVRRLFMTFFTRPPEQIEFFASHSSRVRVLRLACAFMGFFPTCGCIGEFGIWNCTLCLCNWVPCLDDSGNGHLLGSWLLGGTRFLRQCFGDGTHDAVSGIVLTLPFPRNSPSPHLAHHHSADHLLVGLS